jgi:hypothetical protein
MPFETAILSTAFRILAGTMLGYWLSVAGDAPRHTALEANMKRHMDQAIGSRASHSLVFASVAAFVVGCGFTARGLL